MADSSDKRIHATEEQVRSMTRSERIKLSTQPRRKGKRNSHDKSRRSGGGPVTWTVDDTHDSSIGKVGAPTRSKSLTPYRAVIPNGISRYNGYVRS